VVTLEARLTVRLGLLGLCLRRDEEGLIEAFQTGRRCLLPLRQIGSLSYTPKKKTWGPEGEKDHNVLAIEGAKTAQ